MLILIIHTSINIDMSKVESKPFTRQKLVLEYVINLVESNPGQVTFLIDPIDLRNYDSDLNDHKNAEIALQEIVENFEGNITTELKSHKEEWKEIETITGGDTNRVRTVTKLEIHVEDIEKLRQQYLSFCESEPVSFVLYEDGRLIKDNDESSDCYKMREDNFRFELILFLARSKKFFSSKSLAEEMKVTQSKIIKTITDLKRMISKNLHVSNTAVIVNDPDTDSGYGILNTKVKE